MRGKTGTINGVNALSGIIAMPDGRYRYFSAMVNHHIGDGDEAVKLIDQLVLAAASQSAGRIASAPPLPAAR
jgi:D-alanyl-D-alanine carboxypeptidase